MAKKWSPLPSISSDSFLFILFGITLTEHWALASAKVLSNVSLCLYNQSSFMFSWTSTSGISQPIPPHSPGTVFLGLILLEVFYRVFPFFSFSVPVLITLNNPTLVKLVKKEADNF